MMSFDPIKGCQQSVTVINHIVHHPQPGIIGKLSDPLGIEQNQCPLRGWQFAYQPENLAIELSLRLLSIDNIAETNMPECKIGTKVVSSEVTDGFRNFGDHGAIPSAN